MRPDDVADALMDLPQDRRSEVLDLLPPAQRLRVTRLLGYQGATARGLMGLDFVQFQPGTTVGLALTVVRRSAAIQPEAFTLLFSIGTGGRLARVRSLVRALQLPTDTLLLHVCDSNPTHSPLTSSYRCINND
jgi:Mg/Co/Ni transporter MgtE